MNRDYFDIALQGRHRFRDYLIGVSLVFSILLTASIVCAISIFVINFFTKSYDTSDKNWLNLFIYGNLFYSVTLVGVMFIALLLGLFSAIEGIHKRKFLTLINAEASISWHRVFEGFIVSLVLSIITVFIRYLIYPSRYAIAFNALEWLAFLPLALLVTPIISLGVSLFYGYLLQGLGVLTRKYLFISLPLCVFLYCLTQKTIDDSILAGLGSIFTTWIILKDRRIELLIGITAANSLVGMLIISPLDSKLSYPSILKITDSTYLPLALSLITFVLSKGLFYYICFVLPRDQNT